MSSRVPLGRTEAPRRAASTMRGTLISFFSVLGLALPTFIYFKRQNDAKAREMYAQTRIKTGAMSQMSSGEKI
ncbi:hypothetical protein JCM8115_004518 [Rhodotorula mucilaginosa]|uniref:Uncharacterized protein n=1 Tax=Rhodotorula mucilaginosa TaxID=5537 RepID=A0A9P7B662_RHOMI|nr:hypothetical protein C6P46_003736 [Rhodotorula mucilaginosa]TKA52702.1 hypothetical protein B0A53_04155 [Rhodotorula sp. CCFEE 5036]